MVEENYVQNPDERTMLLGSCAKHSVEEQKNSSPFKKNIVYQLEPLVDTHWHSVEKIIKNIEGADEVWDYDLDNIEILRKYGVDAKFRPCLYTESLRRIQNKEEPEIDVLFYGTLTPYRTKFVHDCIDGYSFTDEMNEKFGKISFAMGYNFLGERLDNLIANSKIVLNLNPYDGDCRQQQTRIFYALTNNKCVLSQQSSRNYFGNCINEFTTKTEMIDKIMYLIETEKWRDYTNVDYKNYSHNMRRLFKI